MSQVTALSVLVSVYLQSVLAASSEDAEAFLSPLASRSKVREVIRGLTATRQLAMVSMETQTILHVEGSLPEFPEEPVAPVQPRIPRPSRTAPPASERKPFVSRAKSQDKPAWKRPDRTSSPDRPAAGATDRKGPARPLRPAESRGAGSFRPGAASRPFERKTGGGFGSPRRFAERPPARPESSEPGTGLRADGTPKKPRWRDMPGGRPDQKGKPARFGPRRDEAGTERRSSAAPPRAGGTRPPQRREGSFRPAGGAKPWVKRESSGLPDRPSGRPAERPASRPYGSGSRPAAAGRPSGPPRSFRGDRPATDRPRTDRPRTGRPSYGAPSREGRPQSGPRPDGFAARPRGNRPFNRPRPAGPGRPSVGGRPPVDRSNRPLRPGGSGEAADPRKSFSPRPGAGSASGRSFSKSSRPPFSGGGKPPGGAGFPKRSGTGSGFNKGPGQGPKSGPRPGGRPGPKSSTRPPSRFPSRPKKRPE